MGQLKVLVSGGGIAGNALAFWLSKIGHDVTVIERFPELRTSGLQLDLRGPGIEVLRMMGLDEGFRACAVQEEGMALVDNGGRRWAYFGANRSGKGTQAFTSDYEIMRGDLCRLLHDATDDRVKYVFGTWIQRIEQTDEFADVLFSDGRRERFDLVVGADGQGSRTRRMMLDPDVPDPLHPTGMIAGYFTMPREARKDEQSIATIYLAPSTRFMMTRRHSPHRIQVYLIFRADANQLKRGNMGEEKRMFKEVYRGAGWESDSLLQGLEDSDDFYYDRVGFVQMDSWSRGRIVLLGDAAHSSSNMTGMGTTSSMVGAYILAGEIQKHCGSGSGGKDLHDAVPKDGLDAALKAYEDQFRPFIDDVHRDLSEEAPWWELFFRTRIGIAILYLLVAVALFFRLDVLARYVIKEDVKNWDLPEYRALLEG